MEIEAEQEVGEALYGIDMDPSERLCCRKEY
jgi:hypothetical protein